MPITPSGILSKPLDLLRDTVAASSSFQTWTGAANSTAALAFVKVPFVETNSAGELPAIPLAVIEGPVSYSRDKIAGGGFNETDGRGTLFLSFMDEITEADHADAHFDFLNNVGAVLSDMLLLFGQAGYLNAVGLSLEFGPSRARPDSDEEQTEAENLYEIRFEVEYESL